MEVNIIVRGIALTAIVEDEDSEDWELVDIVIGGESLGEWLTKEFWEKVESELEEKLRIEGLF